MSDPVLSDDAPSLYPPPPPSFSVLAEPREEVALLLDPHEPVLGDDEGDEVTTAAPLSSLLFPPPPPPARHHNEETDADVSLMLPDARAVVQNWSRNNNNNAAAYVSTSVSYGGAGLQECGGNASLMAPPPPPLPDVSTIGYGEGGDVAMIRPLYDTIIDMPYIDRRAVRPIVVSVFCRVAKKIVAVTASSSKEKVEETTAAVSPSAAEASTSCVAEDSDARPRGPAAATVGTDSLLEQPSAPPTKEYWEDKGSLRCPLWPDTRLGELVLCLLRRSESLEALLTSYCERRALPLQSFPVHEVTSRISMLKLSVSVGRTESAESQRVVEHGRLGSLRFIRDGPGAKGFPFVCATPSKRTAGAAAMGGLEWTAESLVAQLVSPQQKLMLLIALDEIRLDQSIASA